MVPGIAGIAGAAVTNTFTFTATIGSASNNYIIATAATSAGWNGTSPLHAIITINADLGSTSSSNPAIRDIAGTGGLPTGSHIIVTVNSGKLLWGAGGDEGDGAVSGNGQNGTAGGDALYTRTPTTIHNLGTIASGGGGGGGGGAGNELDPKIGGFSPGGDGGNGRNGNSTAGNDSGESAINGAGSGGYGGARGTNGAAGGNGTTGTGGTAGAAGNAINGVSYVTFTATGTIIGPQAN